MPPERGLPFPAETVKMVEQGALRVPLSSPLTSRWVNFPRSSPLASFYICAAADLFQARQKEKKRASGVRPLGGDAVFDHRGAVSRAFAVPVAPYLCTGRGWDKVILKTLKLISHPNLCCTGRGREKKSPTTDRALLTP